LKFEIRILLPIRNFGLIKSRFEGFFYRACNTNRWCCAPFTRTNRYQSHRDLARGCSFKLIRECSTVSIYVQNISRCIHKTEHGKDLKSNKIQNTRLS